MRNSPPQGRLLMTNSPPWERQLLKNSSRYYSVSCIPDSKAQDSGFHREKFPHSGIRIPLHYLVSNLGWYESVYYGINNEVHLVRKSTLKLATFSSLVFIRLILNEIQPFKNCKTYKKVYRRPDNVSISS